MTAEDPVEYNLDGINQVMVHEEIGLTFAAALKAFLRQDPNIIMVGEIRDLETGVDRRQGGAHRPPGALDAAHQRRARARSTADRHGHRAVPGRLLGQPRSWPSGWCAGSATSCKQPVDAARRRCCASCS